MSAAAQQSWGEGKTGVPACCSVCEAPELFLLLCLLISDPEWFTFWTQILILNFQRSRDPVPGLNDSIFVKTQFSPNWSIYSILISIKTLADLLSENDKLVPKFIQDSQNNFEKGEQKKNKDRKLMLPNFRNYYKTTVIKPYSTGVNRRK